MIEAEDPDAPDSPESGAPEPGKRPGERVAKAIARAGLGSRREAEGWIAEGRVAVNGVRVDAAALNVMPGDRVEVDGRPLPERERTRLWLYHKPRGYVTTTHDPEGRETVFSILPEGLPRVMTIGRLDINTEGLLLLTNDGGLARILELPETGWLRRYRVRAFGRTTPEALEKLRDGVEIDGFAYGAIEAEIERQQADNVWLRFGLREGKNREVKRVAEHLGLAVNRLIRISFGPFQLGALPEGGVEEVRTRTLKEQIGKRLAEEAGLDFDAAMADGGEDAPRRTGGRGAGRPAAAAPDRSGLADPSKRVGRRAPIARPRDMAPPSAPAESGERPARTTRAAPIADRKGRTVKVERVAHDAADAPKKRVRKRDDGAAERFGAAGRPGRPPRAGGKPEAGAPRARRGDAPGGDRPARFARDDPRPAGERSSGGERRPGRPAAGGADRPARPSRGKPFGARGEGARAPRDRPQEERPQGDRPRSSAPRSSAPRWRDDAPAGAGAPAQRSGRDRPERPAGDRPPRADRPASKPRDRAFEGKSSAGKSSAGKPSAAKPFGRPGGGKPDAARGGREGPKPGDRPRGPKPSGSKPGGARIGDDRPRGKGPGGHKPGGSMPRGPGGPSRGGGAGKGRPGGADRRR